MVRFRHMAVRESLVQIMLLVQELVRLRGRMQTEIFGYSVVVLICGMICGNTLSTPMNGHGLKETKFTSDFMRLAILAILLSATRITYPVAGHMLQPGQTIMETFGCSGGGVHLRMLYTWLRIATTFGNTIFP